MKRMYKSTVESPYGERGYRKVLAIMKSILCQFSFILVVFCSSMAKFGYGELLGLAIRTSL